MISIGFEDTMFSREAGQNTQRRINEMLQEFSEWRNWDELEKGRGIFESSSRDLVLVKDISYFSWCEHHLMPFLGTVSIAYLPEGYIVGLSKLARTVHKFASRPQLQERLTEEIADYLDKWIPENGGVMVQVTGRHFCMEIRGVRTPAQTVTCAVRGKFARDVSLKAETLELIKC